MPNVSLFFKKSSSRFNRSALYIMRNNVPFVGIGAELFSSQMPNGFVPILRSVVRFSLCPSKWAMHMRPDYHSRCTIFVVDTTIAIVSETLTQGAHILEPAIHAEVFSFFLRLLMYLSKGCCWGDATFPWVIRLNTMRHICGFSSPMWQQRWALARRTLGPSKPPSHHFTIWHLITDAMRPGMCAFSNIAARLQFFSYGQIFSRTNIWSTSIHSTVHMCLFNMHAVTTSKCSRLPRPPARPIYNFAERTRCKQDFPPLDKALTLLNNKPNKVIQHWGGHGLRNNTLCTVRSSTDPNHHDLQYPHYKQLFLQATLYAILSSVFWPKANLWAAPACRQPIFGAGFFSKNLRQTSQHRVFEQFRERYILSD